MVSISGEEIIMTSDNNRITLTTHRLINKTESLRNEILLQDVTSYEIVYKRQNYYLRLTLLFATITIVLLSMFFTGRPPFDDKSDSGGVTGLLFSLIATAISLYFYLTHNKKTLRIASRFNEIEFGIDELRRASLNKFLERLEVESDLRKKQQ